MRTRHLLLLILAIFALAAAYLFYRRSTEGSIPPGSSGFEDSYVKALELGCARCDFERFFAVKAGGTKRTLVPDILIDLTSFERELDAALSVNTSKDVGVIVYHGLQTLETNQFIYRPEIEFVGLKELNDDVWDLETIPDSRYSIDLMNGSLVRTGPGHGWETYKSHMHVHRTIQDATNDPGFQNAPSVSEGDDVRYYIFKYDGRLSKLLGQSFGLKASRLKLISTAEPSIEPGHTGEMRHHVAIALCTVEANGTVAELVEDRSYWPFNFRMKALDIGSPCPYRCADAHFPDKGIPIRASCTPQDQSCTHTPRHYN